MADDAPSIAVDGKDAGSSSRPSQTRPIVGRPPAPASLKHSEAFNAVYRRGRWARGSSLSVGILPNPLGRTRIGLRTRRGLKGAVVRNRLKRQLRTIVYGNHVSFRPGLDIVVVVHPPRLPAETDLLKTELIGLCKRAGALA